MNTETSTTTRSFIHIGASIRNPGAVGDEASVRELDLEAGNDGCRLTSNRPIRTFNFGFATATSPVFNSRWSRIPDRKPEATPFAEGPQGRGHPAHTPGRRSHDGTRVEPPGTPASQGPRRWGAEDSRRYPRDPRQVTPLPPRPGVTGGQSLPGCYPRSAGGGVCEPNLLVSQTFASWNLTGEFLRRLDALKRAA
jgi:hypothetical protein